MTLKLINLRLCFWLKVYLLLFWFNCYFEKSLPCKIDIFPVPTFLLISGSATTGIRWLLGYLFFIIIYALLFLWNICLVYAIRDTCPCGRFSTSLRDLLRKDLSWSFSWKYSFNGEVKLKYHFQYLKWITPIDILITGTQDAVDHPRNLIKGILFMQDSNSKTKSSSYLGNLKIVFRSRNYTVILFTNYSGSIFIAAWIYLNLYFRDSNQILWLPSDIIYQRKKLLGLWEGWS